MLFVALKSTRLVFCNNIKKDCAGKINNYTDRRDARKELKEEKVRESEGLDPESQLNAHDTTNSCLPCPTAPAIGQFKLLQVSHHHCLHIDTGTLVYSGKEWKQKLAEQIKKKTHKINETTLPQCADLF